MATAADVITDVANKLNDPSKTTYTDGVVLPFVGMANRELQIILGLNGIPILKEKSAVIEVAAAAVTLTLPADFIEPISLWERADGSTLENDFIEMTERDIEPIEDQTETLRYWSFRDGEIKFVGATTAREVKLLYKRGLTALNDVGTALEIAESQVWMAERVAQMVESDVMNSPSKALAREPKVIEARNMLITKLLKNTQGVGVRRRPYRGYGSRKVT